MHTTELSDYLVPCILGPHPHHRRAGPSDAAAEGNHAQPVRAAGEAGDVCDTCAAEHARQPSHPLESFLGLATDA